MSSLSKYVYKIARDLSTADPVFSESLLLSSIFSTGAILKNSFYLDNLLNVQLKTAATSEEKKKERDAGAEAKQNESLRFSKPINDVLNYFYTHLSKGSDGSIIVREYKKMLQDDPIYTDLVRRGEEANVQARGNIRAEISKVISEARSEIAELYLDGSVKSKSSLKQKCSKILESIVDEVDLPEEDKESYTKGGLKEVADICKENSEKKEILNEFDKYVDSLREVMADKISSSRKFGTTNVFSPVITSGLANTTRVTKEKLSTLEDILGTKLLNAEEEVVRKLVIHVPIALRNKEESSLQGIIEKILSMKGFAKSQRMLKDIVYDIIADTLVLDSRLEHNFINSAVRSIRAGERVCIKRSGSKTNKFGFLYYDAFKNMYTVNIGGFLLNRLSDVYKEYEKARTGLRAMKPNALKVSLEAKEGLRDKLVRNFKQEAYKYKDELDDLGIKYNLEETTSQYGRLIGFLTREKFQSYLKDLKKKDQLTYKLIVACDPNIRLYGENAVSPLKIEIDQIEKRQIPGLDVANYSSLDAPVFDDEGSTSDLGSRVEDESAEDVASAGSSKADEELLKRYIYKLKEGLPLTSIKRKFLEAKIEHFTNRANFEQYSRLNKKYYGGELNEQELPPWRLFFIQDYNIDLAIKAKVFRNTEVLDESTGELRPGKKISDNSIDELYTSLSAKAKMEDFDVVDPVINRTIVTINNRYPSSGGVGEATLKWLDDSLNMPHDKHDIDRTRNKNVPKDFTVDDAKTILAEAYISTTLSFLQSGLMSPSELKKAKDKLKIFISGDPKRQLRLLDKYLPENFFDKYKAISNKMESEYFFLIQDLFGTEELAVKDPDLEKNKKKIESYTRSRKLILESIKEYQDEISEVYDNAKNKSEAISEIMGDETEEVEFDESGNPVIKNETIAQKIAEVYFDKINFSPKSQDKNVVDAVMQRIALLISESNLANLENSLSARINEKSTSDILLTKISEDSSSKSLGLKKEILEVLSKSITSYKKILPSLSRLAPLKSSLADYIKKIESQLELMGEFERTPEYKEKVANILNEKKDILVSNLKNVSEDDELDGVISALENEFDADSMSRELLQDTLKELEVVTKEILEFLEEKEKNKNSVIRDYTRKVGDLIAEAKTRFRVTENNFESPVMLASYKLLKDTIFNLGDITEENQNILYKQMKDIIPKAFSRGNVNKSEYNNYLNLIRRSVTNYSSESSSSKRELKDLFLELPEFKDLKIDPSVLNNNNILNSMIENKLPSDIDTSSAKDFLMKAMESEYRNSFPNFEIKNKKYTSSKEGVFYSEDSKLCRDIIVADMNLSEEEWEKRERKRLNIMIDSHIKNEIPMSNSDKLKYTEAKLKRPEERTDSDKKFMNYFRKKILPISEVVKYNSLVRSMIIESLMER